VTFRHTQGAAPDDRFAGAAHACECCHPPRRFDYLHGLHTHQTHTAAAAAAAASEGAFEKTRAVVSAPTPGSPAAEACVPAEAAGQRAFFFVRRHAQLGAAAGSKAESKAAFKSGEVVVDGVAATEARVLRGGETVQVCVGPASKPPLT
jgi:hypothetical protein